MLLLAPILVVPLGLRLAPLSGGNAKRLLRFARFAQPLGAAAALVAFFLPVGWPGGIAATGWLVVCAIAGLAGLAELYEARSVHPRHLLPAAALGFLTVGSAWLVGARSGIYLGYTPLVAELTSVHFHYAGFAATMMSALALAALRDSRLCSGAGLLIVVGTPVTAAGVATGTPALTVVGPVLLVSGILVTSGLTALVIAPRLRSKKARWFLTISAAGVVVPMLLGLDFAAARIFPIPALDVRTMALVHGNLNAIVFALLGFVGWTMA